MFLLCLCVRVKAYTWWRLINLMFVSFCLILSNEWLWLAWYLLWCNLCGATCASIPPDYCSRVTEGYAKNLKPVCQVYWMSSFHGVKMGPQQLLNKDLRLFSTSFPLKTSCEPSKQGQHTNLCSNMFLLATWFIISLYSKESNNEK